MTNPSAFIVGTRVIYARGVKGTLINKHGVIKETWNDTYHNIPFAQVAFDGMDGNGFPCLVANLELE